MKRVFPKAVLGLTAGVLLAAPTAALALPGDADLSYGAYFRFRQETWDDVFDLSDYDGSVPGTVDDRNEFRMKTSLWAKMDWAKKYGLFTKLTNEAKYYMSHERSGTASFDEWDEDEIVVDNLYAYANDVLGLPVSLTVGRQDFVFQYGEGFLIMDGTPLDGSRTVFFDAVKARVTLSDKANFDLVYIDNHKDDDRLEIDHAKDTPLIESDEQGVVVYGRTKFGNLGLDPYYIYKNEENSPGAPYSTYGELDLHTFGARAVFKNGPWDGKAEFAWQTGDYDNNVDREGYGGYVAAGRIFKEVKYSPRVELEYVNLSGDDPSTADKDEAFDPLFSRWPWLSELLILTEAKERGIAYTTNQIWYRARLTLALTETTGLNFWYNYIEANETAGGGAFFGTGKDRGDLYQIQLDHKFTKNIDGYLRLEYLDPGDFYANQDSAIFVRWQLQAKF